MSGVVEETAAMDMQPVASGAAREIECEFRFDPLDCVHEQRRRLELERLFAAREAFIPMREPGFLGPFRTHASLYRIADRRCGANQVSAEGFCLAL